MNIRDIHQHNLLIKIKEDEDDADDLEDNDFADINLGFSLIGPKGKLTQTLKSKNDQQDDYHFFIFIFFFCWQIIQ